MSLELREIPPQPYAERPRSFFGHPRELATLFFTEMWERFSYYGGRALLILFMTAAPARGGLGLDAIHAGAVYGLYASGVYLCSLPGGWIADRLIGQRHAILLGAAFISIGNMLLATSSGKTLVYVSLLVIALGTGLLKPNISCMVGALYAREACSFRRDAGFSIFYFGINLGGFLAPLIVGTIGETSGFRSGFIASALAMALGLVIFWTKTPSSRTSHPPGSSLPAQRHRNDIYALAAAVVILGSASAALAAEWLRIDPVDLANIAGLAMGVTGVGFFATVLSSAKTSAPEKRRIGVIAVFFLCSMLFWAGYEQAGSTLNLFARDYTDRSLFGTLFAAQQHPASWYQAVPPLFILAQAPLFAWAWTALGRRGRDPAAAVKFAIALLYLAAGFIVMMIAATLVARTGRAAMPAWLIATYLLHTMGELCLSPIGLSSVSRLSPQRYGGQMMGMWFLGTAIGNLTAGLIGGAIGGGTLQQMPYRFGTMAVAAVAGALLMLGISSRITRWEKR